MTNKRIDDFIAVATTRYDANPVVWEHVYNQLRGLLSKDDKDELERQWYPIVYKKDLEDWDELFLETTIDESKLANQLDRNDDNDKQSQLYELYRQQQIAGMQNAAAQYQPGGYVNPYGGSTSTAGGIYPVETQSSKSLLDRICGR